VPISPSNVRLFVSSMAPKSKSKPLDIVFLLFFDFFPKDQGLLSPNSFVPSFASLSLPTFAVFSSFLSVVVAVPMLKSQVLPQAPKLLLSVALVFESFSPKSKSSLGASSRLMSWNVEVVFVYVVVGAAAA
jgi:hypothetical protein